jgi:ABC transporter substrate binding protein (PQQ-dependent alcohol dehydrogenase system)
VIRPLLGIFAAICLTGSAIAQGPATELPIGFVDLTDDPRFDPDYAYNFVPVRPLGPAFDGAALGVADAQQIGGVIDVDFSLRRVSGAEVSELVAAIEAWVAEGIHFVLADLPGDEMLALSLAVADLPVTVFNVSAYDDRLRGESCQFNLIHTIPSRQMLTDSIVQYLVSKNWRNILVLQGPLAEDQATVDALTQSVNFFGARIVDTRSILLSNDPRNRDEGNMALVTAGANYDVAYVADADGEFARFYAPYQATSPRPIVGASGLVALGWHWSWDRAGAPQVNDRFEDMHGRRMDDTDWAAWAAVRAITQGALRSQSTEYGPMLEFILSDRMNLDGAKGFTMSVRPWDHQVRQVILLSTGNAVIEFAPLEGFLHQTNDLDTLGADERVSSCQF